MNKEKLIPIKRLCVYYEVDVSLFYELQDFDIIEILSVEDANFIHVDKVNVLEKVIRLQKDLNVNLEGVDVALNLLNKISELQTELYAVRNRLHLYED